MMKKIASLSFVGSILALLPHIALAQQTYTPLAPLPNTTTSSGNAVALGDYLSQIFLLAIGVAAVIAVVMLVVAGLEYIGGASSESARKDAKDRIFNAIIGLLIALGSWVVLYAINPAILSGNLVFPNVTLSGSSGTSTSTGFGPGPSSGTGSGSGSGSGPSSGSSTGSTGSGSSSYSGSGSTGTGSSNYSGTGSTGSGSSSYSSNSSSSTGSTNTPPPSLQVTVDTTTDRTLLTSCLTHYQVNGMTPACAPADLNNDNVIDSNDLTAFSKAVSYDLNGDGILDLSSTNNNISSCHLRSGAWQAWAQWRASQSSGPSFVIPPSRNSIVYGTFNCSENDYGNLAISRYEMDSLGAALYNATYLDPQTYTPQYIDMNQLRTIISDCLLASYSTYFSRPGYCRNPYNVASIHNIDLVDVLYSSILQHDLNQDDQVNLTDPSTGTNDDLVIFNNCKGQPPTGNCAQADFNMDGRINDVDLNFVGGGALAWSTISTGFAALQANTVNTNLEEVNAYFWSFTTPPDTDVGILNFCMNKRGWGGCEVPDLNDDNIVNSADQSLFQSAVATYDINGDGVVTLR